MDGAGEVPQQIRAAHDVINRQRGPAVDLGAAQFLNLDILEHQHGGVSSESIRADAREKIICEFGVAHAVAGGLHQLEPENVVPERAQAQRILEHPGPHPAAERIARKRATSDGD